MQPFEQVDIARIPLPSTVLDSVDVDVDHQTVDAQFPLALSGRRQNPVGESDAVNHH